ncbi:hypothetical protein LX32DRAFT_575286 [Colletotrichum zoysiae]|uniref:Uncharacterized protein n=1 Tax=Colletotrichum zoysiae TaxID=1216348 RepID=A0AAD9H476_9PEZI|nr:hypothetical protein LX32DRAFT_575286 [Colletotrichum zoysiae]
MDDLGHRTKLATIMAPEYSLQSRPIGQMNDELTGYESLIWHICPKYLTKNEASEIRIQFDEVWQENNQVLWSGTDYSKTKEWALQHEFQTLTTCMGPLMEPGNAKCKRNSSSRAWKLYMRGASALFAWRIAQGQSTTVLTPPPPHRFHPSGMTNYQDMEEPVLKGTLGVFVNRIMMVHPEVSGAEEFVYEAWPNDHYTSWVDKFGEYPDSDWRIVSRKRGRMVWPIGHAQLQTSPEDNCQATQSQRQHEDKQLELHQSRNDQRSEIQPKEPQVIKGSQTVHYFHGFITRTLNFVCRCLSTSRIIFRKLMRRFCGSRQP